MRSFKHINVQTIEEACTLLGEYKGKAKLNAGGTELLSTLKGDYLLDYPEAVINIKTISGLDYIKKENGTLKIGALTKLSDIARSPLLENRYKALVEAVHSVATPQIRNTATIGGNLCQDVRCWYYRYPFQIGGRIVCLRKGGRICNALTGDHRYHSIFGAARVAVYPCVSNCPANTEIPSVLKKVKSGDLMDAARTLMQFNPIPAITGRVCPIFCEPECHRKEFDDPVAVRCVERFLGDTALEKMIDFFARPKVRSGKNIAVIGSGPAGMVVAYYLRRSGHSVTVFERMSEPGGMLLYAIPPYRLPKDVVRKQIQALKGMGIKFEVGVNIGKDVSVSKLMNDFDAVFLAGGAWKEKPLGIKGEEVAQSGLEFLKRVNSGSREIPGRKVAVIGGGNVAIDVARTLLRLGAEPVVIYRRSKDEMPAFKEELEKAEEEGIGFELLALPTKLSQEDGKVTLRCVRMRLGAPDSSGRPRPVRILGSDFTTSFDAVIKAIAEEPEISILPAELRKKIIRGGSSIRLVAKNLFAGGDFLTGPSTVIQAVAAGREAAHLIELSLTKSEQTVESGRTEPEFSTPSFQTAPRVPIPELPVSERVKSLEAEDVSGLNLDKIEKEAQRCFNCGCLAVSPSDIGIALVALNAKIVTTKRTLEAHSFFTASATVSTVLDPDEIVTEIQVPEPPDGARQSYLKFTIRNPIDFAIVSVATLLTLKKGVCRDARIVLGAVAPAPFRAKKAEQLVKDRPIDERVAAESAEQAVADAMPLMMNEYKIEIAKALVKRALLGDH
jgi:NADPH-dependent glutamate synthase beta subunit-like oxidoreductase